MMNLRKLAFWPKRDGSENLTATSEQAFMSKINRLNKEVAALKRDITRLREEVVQVTQTAPKT